MCGSKWLTFTEELKEHLTQSVAQQYKHMRTTKGNGGNGDGSKQ